MFHYHYLNIVIRNGKIIWKHGPNRPFFLYKLSSEIIRTQTTRACLIYQQKVRGTINQFKVKGLSSCFVLNLRMSGENCLIINWHSFRAAPGISIFRVATKDDEYGINRRNNIFTVITRDTVIREFKKSN